MKIMIALLLADGFEEIEALTPLDVLRRGGVDVKTVAVVGDDAKNGFITGAHGITVKCDFTLSCVSPEDFDSVILPGGMPGSLNLDGSPFVDEILRFVQNEGGRIAAICAAPLVLGRRNLLENKRACCYPGFENELVGADVLFDGVVTDGNITTARGMGVALDFALELLSLYKGKTVADKVASSIIKE